MGWVGSVVLYVMLWALTMLCMLPIGMRSQAEQGEIVPGTPPSAPAEAPPWKKKVLWTSLIALFLWLLITAIVLFDVVTLSDLPAF